MSPARNRKTDAGDDEDGDSNSGGSDGGEEDPFFQCLDRVPSGIHIDADFPSDDDEDDEDDDDDVRVSFVSAVGDHAREEQAGVDEEEDEAAAAAKYDYGLWMAAEPMSLEERRRRLLQGMGLASGKELGLRSRSTRELPPDLPRCASRRQQPPSAAAPAAPSAPNAAAAAAGEEDEAPPHPLRTQQPAHVITRCRSDGHLAAPDGAAKPPPPSFCRAYSAPPSQLVRHGSPIHKAGLAVGARDAGASRDAAAAEAEAEDGKAGSGEDGAPGSICRIKNLDTGKEFVVSDHSKDGQWNVLNDLQTGMQLTLDEFDKFLGYTPIVKQLMRRSHGQAAAAAAAGGDKKGAKHGGKKKGGWLKNIKFVANSVTGLILEKEKDGKSAAAPGMAKSVSTSDSGGGGNSERLKVHHYGKSCRELTGLYMCQELRAHEGSIWSMRFSADGRLLASAGEDRVVRVWQVLDCSASSCSIAAQHSQQQDGSVNGLPQPGAAANGAAAPALHAASTKKTRRGKSSKQSLPEHIVMPETVFALSGKPVCSFEGHLDDVLDLSWSKYQQLLSSSMDKTVRLWDMGTNTCLKLFAHNDYVTCIQFNPVDDSYFISGSLDAKVRLWSIPERQVVDWSDLHEMVTATCYSPDGQGAIIGSHKGSCRFYKTSDSKLTQEAQVDIQTKKRKSQAKKITGFQFAPGNPSEVLVTSADSQIRAFDGVNMVHKFRGFKNTSSQISASYTSDGRYVVCASEDSHVYLWKRGGAAPRLTGAATAVGVKMKAWTTTRSFEHFFCKDVSVALPAPTTPPPPPAAAASLEDPFPSGRSEHGLPRDAGEACGEQSCDPLAPASTSSSSSSLSLPHSGQLVGARSPSDLSSSSASFASLRRHHGGSGSPDGGSAWGLVVVTASLGGDIRVYQNFGMPMRIRGQSNLFY